MRRVLLTGLAFTALSGIVANAQYYELPKEEVDTSLEIKQSITYFESVYEDYIGRNDLTFEELRKLIVSMDSYNHTMLMKTEENPTEVKMYLNPIKGVEGDTFNSAQVFLGKDTADSPSLGFYPYEDLSTVEASDNFKVLHELSTGRAEDTPSNHPSLFVGSSDGYDTISRGFLVTNNQVDRSAESVVPNLEEFNKDKMYSVAFILTEEDPTVTGMYVEEEGVPAEESLIHTVASYYSDIYGGEEVE